jgi:signal peptidase II
MTIPRIAWAAYGFAVVVILLDQLSKTWVLSALHMTDPAGGLIDREMWAYHAIPVIDSVFRISFVANDGASFGLLGGGAGRWVLSVFSIAVAGLLTWWATRADRRLLITAIGLLMGGALGNVIDRIRFGFVVDFLDFSQPHFYLGTLRVGFPWVFNIADAAITVGVVLLILDSVLSERAAKVGLAAEKS